MTQAPATPFINALHGLRGLLALWVVLYHASPGLALVRHGYVAVDGFFILSGFVLMRAHASELSPSSIGDAARFLRLRWWRTYPLYAACLVLTLPFFATASLPSGAEVLAALLLLEGWALPGLGINAPVWSLGVEWCGYLAFPLLAWCIAGLSRPTAVKWIVFAAVAEILLMVAVLEASLGDFVGWPALTRMFGGFSCGCLLSVVHQRAGSTAGGPRQDAWLLAACVAALLVLWTLPAAYVLPALVLVVHFTAQPGPVTRRALGGATGMFLGRISFALYLSHFLVLKVAMAAQPAVIDLLGAPGVGRAFCTLGGLLASVGMATLLCVLVEEPARRYGRRYA